MTFYTIILFVLAVFFSWLIIHNVFRSWKPKENFSYDFDEDAKGDKEDDEDDSFFQQMKAEFKPIEVEDVDDMVDELDKEVELSPEEVDFIDADDIELPERK